MSEQVCELFCGAGGMGLGMLWLMAAAVLA